MSTVLCGEMNAALHDHGNVGLRQLLLTQCVSRTPSSPLDSCRPALEIQLPLALDVQRPAGRRPVSQHPPAVTHMRLKPVNLDLLTCLAPPEPEPHSPAGSLHTHTHTHTHTFSLESTHRITNFTAG